MGTYVDFVRAGVGPPNIWDNLRNPIFLGGDAFIERVHKRAPKNVDPGEIPRVQQRSVPKPQSEYQTAAKGDRDGAVAAAFRSGDYTMKQMPEHFGVHYSTVGRAVKKGEQ